MARAQNKKLRSVSGGRDRYPYNQQLQQQKRELRTSTKRESLRDTSRQYLPNRSGRKSRRVEALNNSYAAYSRESEQVLGLTSAGLVQMYDLDNDDEKDASDDSDSLDAISEDDMYVTELENPEQKMRYYKSAGRSMPSIISDRDDNSPVQENRSRPKANYGINDGLSSLRPATRSYSILDEVETLLSPSKVLAPSKPLRLAARLNFTPGAPLADLGTTNNKFSLSIPFEQEESCHDLTFETALSSQRLGDHRRLTKESKSFLERLQDSDCEIDYIDTAIHSSPNKVSRASGYRSSRRDPRYQNGLYATQQESTIEKSLYARNNGMTDELIDLADQNSQDEILSRKRDHIQNEPILSTSRKTSKQVHTAEPDSESEIIASEEEIEWSSSPPRQDTYAQKMNERAKLSISTVSSSLDLSTELSHILFTSTSGVQFYSRRYYRKSPVYGTWVALTIADILKLQEREILNKIDYFWKNHPIKNVFVVALCVNVQYYDSDYRDSTLIILNRMYRRYLKQLYIRTNFFFHS